MHLPSEAKMKAPASATWTRALKCKRPTNEAKPLTRGFSRILEQSASNELSTGHCVTFLWRATAVGCCLAMSSGDAHAAIFVGEGSDFQPWVAVLLSACAIILCVANYLFLRTHELSRAQLNADRVIRILRARRTLTALKVPAPLHDTGTMLLKVGYTFVCYALLSAKSVVAVNCGLVFAIALVAANVVRILKWVFHPDSVFHRKHLLFRKSPTFIRIRLMFELVRRFVYFVLAYSFNGW